MNQTKSAAVIGVPAGTVLGTAIGAAAGAGAYNKKVKNAYGDDVDVDDIPTADCANKQYRDRLAKYFKSNKDVASGLALYFENKKASDLYDIEQNECESILNLWDIRPQYKEGIQRCDKLVNKNRHVATTIVNTEDVQTLIKGNGYTVEGVCPGQAKTMNITECMTEVVNSCRYTSVKYVRSDVYCKGSGPKDSCVDVDTIERQLKELDSLLSGIEPLMNRSATQPNKGKEIGKGAAIGAVTGAGAGGLATAITALVEKNNISCKVGDGLNSVALGKSHTIDSLKDFYVKWNLKLPDTITPTSVVSDVASWQQACAQFNNRLMDCPNVQINLKRAVDKTYKLINAACVQSGSMCVPNPAAMNSQRIE